MPSQSYESIRADRRNSSSRKLYIFMGVAFFIIIATSIAFAVYYLAFEDNSDDDFYTDIETPIFNSSSTHTQLKSAVTESSFMSSLDTKTDVFDPKSHKNFKLFNSESCGRQKYAKRVQNGETTSPLEFPWIVALFRMIDKTTNDVEYFCGGSLISTKIVLSATHCVLPSLNLKFVRLGEQNLETPIDCIPDDECAPPVQDIYDFSITTHPDFDPVLKVNDIALIKLTEMAKLEQKNIATICLPFDYPQLPRHLVVIGFGLIEGIKYNTELRKGSLEVIKNDQCEQDYMKFDVAKHFLESQFCALGKKKKMRKGELKEYDVDSCSGDSGSPAQSGSAKTSQFIQFGVVSGGLPIICGSNNTAPGFYTKVFDFLPWILDNSE